MGEVYLDHHSATRPLPEVVEAMLPFFGRYWGSTTSLHQKGQELFAPMKERLELLLRSLGASSADRVYFFSSYAEAMGHLFFSYYLEEMRPSGKNTVLTTNTEEAALLMSLKRLEELGGHGHILPVDAQGQLTRERLSEAIKPRSSLLSLSGANGLTGVIQPIEELSSLCKEKGIHVHVDVSYLIGKIPFSFKDLDIDFLTFDGSVLHAPKGTAALVVKEKAVLPSPLSSMTGICVGGLVALAKALEVGVERTELMGLEVARLRDKLERGVLQGCPGAQVILKKTRRLPNCTVLTFSKIHSDALLFLLHRHQVYASLGGGHAQRLSHLLMASGIDPILAQCALSFSLSFQTTEEEIDQAIAVIIKCVHQLNQQSMALI
jgi:cysteine desulfurase